MTTFPADHCQANIAIHHVPAVSIFSLLSLYNHMDWNLSVFLPN